MPWERERTNFNALQIGDNNSFCHAYSVEIAVFEKITATPAKQWPLLTADNYSLHLWMEASILTEGKKSLSYKENP